MEENHTKPEKPVKGIHISGMNAAIIAVSIFLCILLTATARHVSVTIQDTDQALDAYYTCTQIGGFFKNGSDYLTEQARLYVVTADRACMDHYFTELHITRRRDEAVKLLKSFDMEDAANTYLQAALDKSQVLMDREIYAMALVSLAHGYDEAALPQEVQKAPLTEEDRAMAKEDLRAKADELVFGHDYQAVQEQISFDVEDSIYALGDTVEQHMNNRYDNLRRAMTQHQLLLGIHFAATLASFSFTLLLVILPMRGFVKAIKDRKPLRVSGAYECKCLAQTCNAMFARITDDERMLRHQAEHDALTGLLNRGAFDALQDSLEAHSGPLALLLVDVDKFKQVNDGYGHEMGDKVLKKVAGLLSENFRTSDYPARIGGDEFAVIVMDAVQEEQSAIAAKIAAINELLTNPADGLPVVSLSVGGAFSKDGFVGSLYKNADLALYAVKEHGRCGCRFYTPELA